MKLSILIPTLPERKLMFDKLVNKIESQFGDLKAEVVYNEYIDLSIGEKRNMLLHFAYGEYVAFVDDDDDVSDNYISLLMEGIEKGVDCCSLMEVYSINGINEGIFEHSIKYKEWKTKIPRIDTDDVKYERYPNHLNCIKSSIAKQFKFPEKNFGEDHDWSKQIHESGLIKTEHYIPEVIYYYKKVTK